MSISASSRVRVLVDVQRVADVGPDVDMVDVEHRQLVDARVRAACRSRLAVSFVAGFGVDFAGASRLTRSSATILADEVLVRHDATVLQAFFGELCARDAR
jgi:hypothetical protein